MSHEPVIRTALRLKLQSELEGHVLPPDAAEAPSLARNIASRSPSVELSEANPLSAAFGRACLSLREDQRMVLGETQGLQELFEQLNASNEKSKKESPFRRGVQRLGPVLTVLGSSINLATPLAALDPTANNAFGIIQSVVTVRWSLGYPRMLRLIDVALDCYRSLWCGRKVPRRYPSNAPKSSYNRKM